MSIGMTTPAGGEGRATPSAEREAKQGRNVNRVGQRRKDEKLLSLRERGRSEPHPL